MRLNTKSYVLPLAMIGFALPAHAALVIGYTSGDQTTVPEVSNTDLLQTSVSSTVFLDSTGAVNPATFTIESGGGAAVLTDGSKGITDPGSNATFATAGNDSNIWGGGYQTDATMGSRATYNFNLAVNTAGYDITTVNVFTGWGDSGRDHLAVEVLYSTVAAPTTFISLATLNYNPTSTPGPVWAQANLTGITATGVAAISFNFNIDTEAGYSGYRELDVLGTATAVPEPSAALLGGLGMLALLRRRRA